MKKKLLALLLVLCLAMTSFAVLTACGDDDKSSTEDNTGAETPDDGTIGGGNISEAEVVVDDLASISIPGLIDAIKEGYTELPSSPEVNITDMLSEINAYVDLPTIDSSISVKDGYVTIKNSEDGNMYVGINKDFCMVMVSEDGEVYEAEELIPSEALSDISNVGDDFQDLIDMVEYYVDLIFELGYLPAISADDLVYQNGWYCISDAYASELAKGVLYTAYSFYEAELSENDMLEIDQMVDEMLTAIDVTIGFAVDEGNICGILVAVSVADTEVAFGVAGSASASIEAKLDYVNGVAIFDCFKVDADINIPDAEIDIDADLSIVASYGEGGAVALDTVVNADVKVDGISVAGGITIALNCASDGSISTEINADVNTRDYWESSYDGNVYDYTYAYSLDFSAAFDQYLMPVSFNASGSYETNEYYLGYYYNSNNSTYVSADTYGDLKVEFEIDASVDRENSSAEITANMKSELSNPHVDHVYVNIYNSDYEGQEDTIKQETIAMLTNNSEYAYMFDTAEGNFSVEASLTIDGNDASLSVSHTDAEAYKSTFTATAELGSELAVAPSDDIKDVIQSYVYETYGFRRAVSIAENIADQASVVLTLADVTEDQDDLYPLANITKAYSVSYEGVEETFIIYQFADYSGYDWMIQNINESDSDNGYVDYYYYYSGYVIVCGNQDIVSVFNPSDY